MPFTPPIPPLASSSPPGPGHRWHTHPDPIKGGDFWCAQCRTCEHHKDEGFFGPLPLGHKSKADDTAKSDQCTLCYETWQEVEALAESLHKKGLDSHLSIGLAALQLGQFRTILFQRSPLYASAAIAIMRAIFGHSGRSTVAMGLLTDREEPSTVMVDVLHGSGLTVSVPATN